MTSTDRFWLQLSANHRSELLLLRDEWKESDHPVGVVMAPVTSRSNLVAIAAGCKDEMVMMDPCGYLLDRPATKRAKDHFPWLAALHEVETDEDSEAEAEPDDFEYQDRPDTTAEFAEWMARSLENDVSIFEEAGVKPKALVSPCPLIGSMMADAELDAVADAYRAIEGDFDNVVPSFCVEMEFTRTEEGVTRLANTLVGLAPDAVLLRCFQKDLPPIGDRAYLNGLREVVQACTANGIEVMLPNSGWVGWLATAWGASLYSGGAAQSSWFDRVPTPMSATPKIDRLHDSALITRREFDLSEELEAIDGYESCPCEACATMAGSFDSSLARVHQVRSARQESLSLAGLSNHQRRLMVKGRLAGAAQLWQGLPPHLKQSIDGKHLQLWSELA